MTTLNRGWPVRLVEGPVTLRPLRARDGTAWRDLRRANAAWLREWEATRPGDVDGEIGFSAMVRRLRAEARAGRTMPFALEYNGVFVGQLTVAGITWGSLCAAHIGYWIDQKHAGRGIMPTAVAMATDHCLLRMGLHRVEICIRPENANSRRVVEKLGFRLEGIRPKFLHIDGHWRDHYVFVLNSEEAPRGVLEGWRANRPT
ncbi:MAG: GNAT family N-acetyltransferase [Sporichthyaceae bacterium]